MCLLLVVPSLALCTQGRFASLVLRHLDMEWRSCQSDVRQFQTGDGNCLSDLHLVGGVLLALPTVCVPSLRNVDHDPQTKSAVLVETR